MPRTGSLSTAERRQSLLEAATAVVREQGPRTSMDAMATAGGVTKPILYRHFGDRQGLVSAIGERFEQQLDEAIRAALATFGRAEEGAVLRATIDAYLRLIEQETQLYRFLVQQDARSGNETTSAFVAQVSERVAGVLAAGLRANGGDPAPAELWAVGIVGMVHAAGDWWAERRTSMSRADVVDGLAGLLWNGLGAGSAAIRRSPGTGG
ncbi:MAG: TetR family transcriptional regulator [Ilumatobacteraceae bacterium]